MHRIDSDPAASLPTPSAVVGTPGYFRKATATVRGTVVRSDWLNAVQEEIAQVIEGAGLTLDKTAQNQLSLAVSTLIGKALISHATDTTSVSATEQRAILVSATSRADGARSLVAASLNARASGASSFVAASDGSTSGGGTSMDASGANTAILACDERAASGSGVATTGIAAVVLASSGGVGGAHDAGGDYTAVIACKGLGAGLVNVTGAGSVVLASSRATVTGIASVALASDATATLAGTRNFLAAADGNAGGFASGASESVQLAVNTGTDIGTNATACAILASVNCDLGTAATSANSALLACSDVRLDANRSAIIASDGAATGGNDVEVLGDTSAIIASEGGATATKCYIAADVDSSAILASFGSYIDATSGTISTSAVIASVAAKLSGSGVSQASLAASNATLSGSYTAAVACSAAATISGTAAAAVACGVGVTVSGSTAAAIASGGTSADVTVSSANCAAIGVSGSVEVDEGNVVVLGSAFNTTDFPVTDEMSGPGICGGAGAALTWWIDSTTGWTNVETLSVHGMKSGTSQALAFAAAGELWFDTGDGNAVKMGV